MRVAFVFAALCVVAVSGGVIETISNLDVGQIKEQAGQLVEQAKEQAGELVEQAKEAAKPLIEKAKKYIDEHGGLQAILKKSKEELSEWVKGIELPQISAEDFKKALESAGLGEGGDATQALQKLLKQITGSEEDFDLSGILGDANLEDVISGKAEMPPVLSAIVTVGLLASGVGSNLGLGSIMALAAPLGDGPGVFGGPGVLQRIENAQEMIKKAKDYVESHGGLQAVLKKSKEDIEEFVKGIELPQISMDDVKKALESVGLGEGGNATEALQKLLKQITGSEEDFDLTNILGDVSFDDILSGKAEMPLALGAILTIGLLSSGVGSTLGLASIAMG